MTGPPANGSIVVSQAFIFNDARTGATNVVAPNSGFQITHTAILNQDGSVTLTTSKVGTGATAWGYTATAGAGSAQNSATDANGVITFP